MRRDGALKFQGRQPHLSAALAGEAVGLVEDELGPVRFGDYKVAVRDVQLGQLWVVGMSGRRPETVQAALKGAKA